LWLRQLPAQIAGLRFVNKAFPSNSLTRDMTGIKGLGFGASKIFWFAIQFPSTHFQPQNIIDILITPL